MSNKAKCYQKAEELGYAIDECEDEIRLEAPAGYCFDQDHHESVTWFVPGHKGLLSKGHAWRAVWKDLGTAEVCRIKDCEWCQSNVA